MSFARDRLHTHRERGGIYAVIDASALMKHPDTGEWIAAVIYQDADPHSPWWGQSYTTTEARWLEKFRSTGRAVTTVGGSHA